MEDKGKKRRKTDREKRGNYSSVNGIQSNFLLLKKSFIYVDSLLVMYSSVTPAHRHTHTLPSITPAVCACVHVLLLFACCCASVCVMRLDCLSSRDAILQGRKAVLNCTDKINM